MVLFSSRAHPFGGDEILRVDVNEKVVIVLNYAAIVATGCEPFEVLAGTLAFCRARWRINEENQRCPC